MIITPKRAREIANEFLQSRKDPFVDLVEEDRIIFRPSQEIRFEKHKGKIDDIYSIGFGEDWGYETISLFLYVSASTGEVYGILGPANYIGEV